MVYAICKKCLIEYETSPIVCRECNNTLCINCCFKKMVDRHNTDTVTTPNFRNISLKFDKGTKFDENKPDYKAVFTHLDWDFLKDLSKVMTEGEKKYGFENWKKDLEPERIEKAIIRHLKSYLEGEKIDKESNLSHLCHITANCMFLHYYNRKNK